MSYEETVNKVAAYLKKILADVLQKVDPLGRGRERGPPGLVAQIVKNLNNGV